MLRLKREHVEITNDVVVENASCFFVVYFYCWYSIYFNYSIVNVNNTNVIYHPHQLTRCHANFQTVSLSQKKCHVSKAK